MIAVIPARNEAGTIGRAVASLAAQCHAVIVVDDASTDGTAEAAICGPCPRVCARRPRRHRTRGILLALMMAAMASTYLAGPLVALGGGPAGALAWLLTALSLLPMLRYYRMPWWWARWAPPCNGGAAAEACGAGLQPARDF